MLRRDTAKYDHDRRQLSLWLCLALAAMLLLPPAALAQSRDKNVRVGWYESPFNSMDKTGRRSGYAYEYQMKIAAYTGWDYTYVSGSWPDLMQMLANGEIDLMSDVSFTEERAENMLFSDLSMGVEEYCVFVARANRDITPEDYSTLNGKRIGVSKGSVQLDLYRKWAEAHGIRAELVELTGTEVESVELLEAGELDAYITLNAYGDPARLVPKCKIGSSDFFFAVSKDRPDLLDELNAAMNHIQDENPYYNQRMFERHMQAFGTNAFLTEAELSWLSGHGALPVPQVDLQADRGAGFPDAEAGPLLRKAHGDGLPAGALRPRSAERPAGI